MRDPSKCPNCGEHVSPFAAGCAICGAPLDPKRGRHPTLESRIRSFWAARFPSGSRASGRARR